MIRRDLIEYLLDNPMSLQDLSKELGKHLKVVENDVEHLLKSIKHLGYKAVISPASCRKCGFTFTNNKLHRPGKCPQCKADGINAPLIEIKEERKKAL